MFLFHTGSIKSVDEKCKRFEFENRFYSILVRLKVQPWIQIRSDRLSFYSILVRLKVDSDIDISDFVMFLFHTGSIKRPP